MRRTGVCLLDAATAEFIVGEFVDDETRSQLETLLLRMQPRELVYPNRKAKAAAAWDRPTISERSMKVIRIISTLIRFIGTVIVRSMKVLETYGVHAIKNVLQPCEEFWTAEGTLARLRSDTYFGVADGAASSGADVLPAELQRLTGQPLAMSALGGAISYLQKLLMDKELVTLGNFSEYRASAAAEGDADYMVVDGQCLLNLDVIEASGVVGAPGSLLHYLDKTVESRNTHARVCARIACPAGADVCSYDVCQVTGFGKRLFRRWLHHPLHRLERILKRQAAVRMLHENGPLRERVRSKLRRIPDLERMVARVHAAALKQKNEVRFDDASKRRLKEFIVLLDGYVRAPARGLPYNRIAPRSSSHPSRAVRPAWAPRELGLGLPLQQPFGVPFGAPV